ELEELRTAFRQLQELRAGSTERVEDSEELLPDLVEDLMARVREAAHRAQVKASLAQPERIALLEAAEAFGWSDDYAERLGDYVIQERLRDSSALPALITDSGT